MIKHILSVFLSHDSETALQRAEATRVIKLMDECAQSLDQQAATALAEGRFSQYLHDTGERLNRLEASLEVFKGTDLYTSVSRTRPIARDVITVCEEKIKGFRSESVCEDSRAVGGTVHLPAHPFIQRQLIAGLGIMRDPRRPVDLLTSPFEISFSQHLLSRVPSTPCSHFP
jgi:hypothetical protein